MRYANPAGNMHRISDKETLESIDHIYKYYTIFGQHDFLDGIYPGVKTQLDGKIDEVKTHAYSVQHGEVMTYFCKIDRQGRLYNPIGFSSQVRVQRNRQRSKDNWRFRKQEKKVFDLYIEFLRSKNQSHLNLAQRERV